MFAGHPNHKPLDPATTLLSVAQQPWSDRICAILAATKIAMAQHCLPGRITIMSVNVGVKTLEVLVEKWSAQMPNRAVHDYALMNLHIQAVSNISEQLLESRFVLPNQEYGGEGETSKPK